MCLVDQIYTTIIRKYLIACNAFLVYSSLEGGNTTIVIDLQHRDQAHAENLAMGFVSQPS